MKFMPEDTCEERVMVTDYGDWQAMQLIDIVEHDFCHITGSECSFKRDEMDHACEVVDHQANLVPLPSEIPRCW
jgi:hypothetical protein